MIGFMSFFGADLCKRAAPALVAGAVLALATACAARLTEAPLVLHEIDQSVWKVKRPIDWPSSDHRIFVYFDVDETFSACGKELTAKAKEEFATQSEFLFGQACGRLIVLFRPLPVSLDETARQMIAAHEAFHLAAQLHSLLPRIDAVEYPGDPDKAALENIYRFFRNVFRLSTDQRNRNTCGKLETAYRSLPSFEREYVVYKTYWEWPAEFYMREFALEEGMSTAEYRVLRTSLIVNGMDEIVYFAAAHAMEAIELAMARDVWQRRYMEGEHILDLFAESLGCSSLLGPTLQVDSITGEEIFTDVAP